MTLVVEGCGGRVYGVIAAFVIGGQVGVVEVYAGVYDGHFDALAGGIVPGGGRVHAGHAPGYFFVGRGSRVGGFGQGQSVLAYAPQGLAQGGQRD